VFGASIEASLLLQYNPEVLVAPNRADRRCPAVVQTAKTF